MGRRGSLGSKKPGWCYQKEEERRPGRRKHHMSMTTALRKQAEGPLGAYGDGVSSLRLKEPQEAPSRIPYGLLAVLWWLGPRWD